MHLRKEDPLSKKKILEETFKFCFNENQIF